MLKLITIDRPAPCVENSSRGRWLEYAEKAFQMPSMNIFVAQLPSFMALKQSADRVKRFVRLSVRQRRMVTT